jgi:PAS domain S-box-containing protein
MAAEERDTAPRTVDGGDSPAPGSGPLLACGAVAVYCPAVLATPLGPARLLRVEHAVAAVLIDEEAVATALPRLLAAIGAGLGWPYGGVWRPDGAQLRCVATWTAADHAAAAGFAAMSGELVLAAGEGLPGRVLATGAPAWITDVVTELRLPRRTAAAVAGLHTAIAFPLVGSAGSLAVMEFAATERLDPDEDLLATLASLGRRVGQYIDHRRAEDAVHESEARKRAMLDAALDAVITIDHVGRIVEINAAAEHVFGHPPATLVGREMAEALVPDSLRERHRAGLARAAAGGGGELIGRRVEITALHADGRELPVELTITRIDVPGPPMYTGYVRDITQRVEHERELRASRARIVAAADEARRRLERDLHDGAQNRLLAVGLDLKVIQAELGRDLESAARRLSDAREELLLATQELRELARGIHPAVLTELGLIAALRTLARRAPLPVGLAYGNEERLPPAVEATAYFLAAEALVNVARHAQATRAEIRVDVAGRDLVIAIRDDGIGGVDPARGSGLRGMADRLAAVDGRLEIDSPPAAGTTVRGVIPCVW